MKTFLTLGVLVAALAAVPFLGSAYLTSFLFTVLIAYILAQSWDWVAGEMGYVNLGHYCFYGLGAYAFSIALMGKYPAAVAILVAVLLTVAVAAVLAYPLFRLRGDYFAFATLALLPLAELLAYNMDWLTKGGDGIVLPIENVVSQTYLIALVVCVVTFIVTIRINAIRFGYALKGIRNDEDVAEVLGVRIAPVKTAVLALSAAFAAIAGATQAWQMSYIDPATVFGLNVALIPIAMVLFGGSGLRWGPLVGVVLLACLQQWLLVRMEILHATVYGLIILLIGRFMPGGLLRANWIRNNRWLAPLSREHHSFIAQAPAAAAASVKVQGAWPRLPLPHLKPRPGTALLSCRGVRMEFGGNVAVDNVTLDINEGEIVGLIGPNGSGKTTLFNCISRVFKPTAGTLTFDGQPMAALRRDQIAKLGVGRTHQIPRPFGDLTVQENIAIPLMFHDRSLSPGQAFEQARAFMAFADLERRSGDRADALSLQEKKALEFARALACKPRLLLVDEVASGLTPIEIRRFVEQIRHVRDEYGITVIWVEHIFSALAQVVDRVVALEQGAVIANGPLDEVVKNERVLQGYLGSSSAEEAA
jgi:branched-chain amino acid transport system permease protein